MQAVECLRKAFAANVNTSSFAALPPTVVRPSGDGVYDYLGTASGFGGVPRTPKFLLMFFYGLGSNNDAFDIKVTGWRHLGNLPPQGSVIWIPQTLVVLSGIVSSTAKGVAGAPVLDTEFFCDTLTIKTAAVTEPVITNDAGSQAFVQRYSAADDATPAWVKIPLQGVEIWQTQFDQTTGTPTMNALFCYEDE